MKIKIVSNPYSIGKGILDIGNTFETLSETKCFYTITGGFRVNKKHMSIAGTSCNEHSVKVEILEQEW